MSEVEREGFFRRPENVVTSSELDPRYGEQQILPAVERRFEASLEPSRVEKLGALMLRYVEAVIDTCGGNKARAARLLGVSRKTIYRRLGLSK